MRHSTHRWIVITTWIGGLTVCLLGAKAPWQIVFPVVFALGYAHNKLLRQVRAACVDCVKAAHRI